MTTSIGIIASKVSGIIPPPPGVPNDTIESPFAGGYVIQFAGNATGTINDYEDGGVICTPNSSGAAAIVGIVSLGNFASIFGGVLPTKLWGAFTWQSARSGVLSTCSLEIQNSSGARIAGIDSSVANTLSTVLSLNVAPGTPTTAKIAANVRSNGFQFSPPQSVICAVLYIGYEY